jgi:hypothetical protein
VTFTNESYAKGMMFQFQYPVPHGNLLTLFAQTTLDNYTNFNTYNFAQHHKSFTEVFKHDPATQLVCYFNTPVNPSGFGPYNVIDGIDAVRIVATNKATLETLTANYRTTGNASWRFYNAGINYTKRYDPYLKNFGISFWFKNFGGPVGSRQLVIKGGASSPGFYIDINNGNLTVYVRDVLGTVATFATVGKTYDNGSWYHCVLNVSRGVTNYVKLYINNILVASTMTNIPQGSIYGATSDFIIGNGYVGWIDDFIFRHETFTDEEISLLYSWTKETICFGLERLVSSVGILGDEDSSIRTIRFNMTHGTYNPSGAFKWRYKKTVNGVQDSSFTSSTSDVNLAAATPIVYQWNFDAPEISQNDIGVPEYRPSIDLSYLSRVYYARFRVFDGFEYGNWTGLYKFRINERPVAPTNLFVQ